MALYAVARYIKTEEECELAASAAYLDLADKVSFPVSSTASYAGTSPYGCYYKTDPGQLYVMGVLASISCLFNFVDIAGDYPCRENERLAT